MKKTFVVLAAISLVACSSSGPVATGKDTYMITKQSAGGVFVSGGSVKADILTEANAFCKSQGKTMELITSQGKNAIPFARTSSAEAEFKCVPAS